MACRVAKGLSLNSHAAMCAEVFGIPRRVARRAQYVRCVSRHVFLSPLRALGAGGSRASRFSSQLLATHELGQLLDEEMTDDERRDLEDAEEACRRFLAWNLIRDEDGDGDGDPDLRRDVKRRLAQVLGRDAAE